SRVKTKLVQQAYVYTDEIGGFLNRKSVYFHPALAEQEHYPALRQAVQLMTGLKLPDAFILPYLLEDPFKMVPGRFIPNVKTAQAELRDDEVRAIIRLLDDIGEAFFKHFVVTESVTKGLFLVEKKARNIQVYLGSKRSKNYQNLAKHLPEGYKILPAVFYDETHQPGAVLSGEKLYKELLKKVDAEVLGDLVQTGQSTPELQKEFIQQLQEVVFEEGQTYDANSIPAKMVQLFRKRDSNPEALRKKIKLKDQDGTIWPLSDYAFPDWLSMKGAAGETIRLRLTAILPELAPVFALKHRLLDQFEASDRNVLAKKIFDSGAELPISKVARQLQQNYPVLEQGTQLAFAILLGAESPLMMRNFKVNTRTEKMKRLSDEPIWMIESQEIFDSEACLASSYANVARILDPTESGKGLWLFGKQVLLLRPAFSGDRFFSPPLRSDKNTKPIDPIALLNLAFEIWEGLDSQPDTFTWPECEALLPAKPATWVLNPQYALEAEYLPKNLVDWAQGNPAKAHFLVAFGVKDQHHPSIQLREAFEHPDRSFDRKGFNELQKQHPNALTSAIQWAHQKGLLFDPEGESTNWLRRSYRALGNGSGLPLPHLIVVDQSLQYQLSEQASYRIASRKLDTIENRIGLTAIDLIEQLSKVGKFICSIDFKSFQLPNLPLEEQLDESYLEQHATEWQANYYQEWKRERAFEIFLIDQAMPYLLKSEEDILYRYTSGDILIKENQIYINNTTSNLEELLFTVATKSKSLTNGDLAALLRLKNKFSKRDLTDKVFNRPVKHVIELKAAPGLDVAKWALINYLGKKSPEAKAALTNQKGPWFTTTRNDQTLHILLQPILAPDCILSFQNLERLEQEHHQIALYDGAQIHLMSLPELWKHQQFKVRLALDARTWNTLQQQKDLPKEV
ncbi:MAG: hypothetical protein AAFV80_01845, partial [Bacteroidota bacterium]